MTTAALAGAATASPFFGAVQTKLKAQDTSSSSGSSSSDNSLSADNLGTTFLNLLVQELQNQDPTQPMDPTAMVGQMISLNQLDQLISINSALNPTASSTTSSSGSSADAVPGSAGTQAATSDAKSSALAALDPSAQGSSAASALTSSASSAGAQNAALLAAQQAAANPSVPLNLGALHPGALPVSSVNALLGGK